MESLQPERGTHSLDLAQVEIDGPARRVIRLVVIPQAMPVIIPPITSQYLNLIKNSSFGAAIAYPEIVAVFMGSALVATGQAVEIIAITIALILAGAAFLTLSMGYIGLPRHLAEWIGGLGLSKFQLIMALTAF